MKNKYYPHDEERFYCTGCGMKLEQIYTSMYDDKTGEKYFLINKECNNKQCYYSNTYMPLRNMLIGGFFMTVLIYIAGYILKVTG